MISSSIISLLLNKYVLASIGGLIALIVAYFKGSKAAKEAAEAERIRQEAAEQSRLRAAEAKNAYLEKKGEKKNEDINAADTIDQLIGLWDQIQSGKSKDGSSDKDS